jgi:hypothetical protein
MSEYQIKTVSLLSKWLADALQNELLKRIEDHGD